MHIYMFLTYRNMDTYVAVMQLLALSALLVLSATAVSALDLHDTDSQLSSVKDDENRPGRTGKFIAFRTTTSSTVIASTTVLALSTCIAAINAVTCTGRKKKNLQPHIQLIDKYVSRKY